MLGRRVLIGMRKRIALLVLVIAAACVAVWGVARFTLANRDRLRATATSLPGLTNSVQAAYSWSDAVDRIKEDRTPADVGNGPFVIPPELQHYSDRHWFLASQVAEIDKYNVHTCQDYVDLAGMIERGELVNVPGVTDTYVLYGVGAKADDGVFDRYEDKKTVELYSDAQLSQAYQSLAEKQSSLQSDIASLKGQSLKLSKGERAKQSELQRQIVAREQELQAADDDKAALDQFYGQPETRRQLMRDYESLQTLAKNFAGRSYNLDNPSDRLALKLNMLSVLRPEALKILEEVAAVYHQQYGRPLPVSSLVRPEQYQHVLRRYNRNAVLIDTPPHSTGLAFDIDYRFMSSGEQTFLMAQLARIKSEGRIEVIRERNANYHVFAFINGTRPSDDLITASLEKVTPTPPADEAHHAAGQPAKVKGKTQKAKARAGKSHPRKRRK